MKSYYLGLDLGTTTVSLCLLPPDGSAPITASLPHGAALPGKDAARQDPEKLLSAARALLARARESFPGEILSIGVTGQMHGILYLDGAGKALSPLYSWQDQTALLPLPGGKTALEEIREKTGLSLSPGYGLATHYALSRLGLIPREARSLLTAGDYLVTRLAGLSRPLLHPSNAQSLGFFDPGKNGFSGFEALPDFRGELLPAVSPEESPAGAFRGIPVSFAVGDNQAVFFGSLREEDGLLLNLGTGGQLSALVPGPSAPEGLEARPYFFGKTLASYASLSGGRAYAMLEKFVRALREKDEPQYAFLNRLAEKGLREETVLPVDTRFAGTRRDPALRGAITGIGEENFTPGAMTAGFLRGMTRELFDAAPLFGRSFSTLAATGNAVRKNPALREVIGETFALSPRLPRHTEEASFGAALFGAVSAGLLSECAARDLIRYEGEDA